MRVALIVDNPYRDLPGLVLTAMYLCQHGTTCHLVPMNLREQEIWPLVPDFVLLHQLRTLTQEFTTDMLEVGIKIGVLDTEGGVLASLDSYAKTMAPDASVRHKIGCFCSWGSKLAEYAADKAWYLDNQIVVTGSPRFDFYAQPWQQAALKNSPYVDDFPRPIVLINGNFPLVNPGFQTAEAEVRMLVERLGFDKNEVLRWQQVQRETMLGMAELANHLAARFDQVTFVYRPHPFERLETYTDLLDSGGNLRLSRQGTVDGWIMRASAVIQRSCSTAIEAGLAGVPALSPVWIPTPVIMETAEAVSIPCKTEKHLIDQLDAVLEGRLGIPDNIHAALDQLIADWFHKNDGKAHQRVGDCILNTVKNNGKEVRLDRCRDTVYGRLRPRMPFKVRVVIAAKRALGIPANWSIRHMRYFPGESMPVDLAWDHSEKYFDADVVRAIVDAIEACPQAERGEKFRTVGVQSAQERGDYHFGYQQGRSVTMFPQ